MTLFILFALFSPYFHLKKVSVLRDNPNLNVQEIEQSLEEFYGKNLLFLSHQKLKEKLWENFPEFREIDISENWPSEIELKIVVSAPLFNLLNTETANFSVISEDGVILQKTPNQELQTIKIFQYEKPIQLRQQFLSKQEIQSILQARKIFMTEVQLPLQEMHFYYNAKELHFISQDEMAIWIDVDFDIANQLQKLIISSDEIGLGKKIFEHIDLRIPKQIFWKQRIF